jgi:glucokinase
MKHLTNPSEANHHILGFDIGGTKTAVVFGTDTADILLRTEFPTNAHLPFEATFEQIVNHANSVCEETKQLGYPKPAAISVSVGGPLDIERGIIYAPIHLPNWDDVPLKELLTKIYGLPVYVEHDGNAGALAELYFGAGKGCRNIIFLTMGTGLGAGIIFNGQIYRGTTDCAGEVGFIRINRQENASSSWEGSWESYCSAAGLVRLAQIRFPHIWDQDTTAREIIQIALEGDSKACALVAEAGSWLGKGLADLVNILNPERIIIGTLGVVLGDLLLDPARQRMKANAIPRAAQACEIVPSHLGQKIGDVAALMAAIHFLNVQNSSHFQTEPGYSVVKSSLQDGIDVRQKTIATLLPLIHRAAEKIINVFQQGGKVLLCGNGGSAASAQHLAGELCGRYLKDRKPLPAIALTADSSVITCIGNDYQYEDIFSRQITALGKPNDLLIAFTTSGKSSNIIKAIDTAKLQGVQTVALTGQNGLHGLDADLTLPVPSLITARIQEEHDAIIHAICELIDLAFTDL